jgi:hypothetical protein
VLEARVLRVLGISPDEHLEERGVYPPREAGGDMAEVPAGSYQPGREEVVLVEEWLSDAELEHHFSADPTLSAALPSRHGLVKRLDVDPRILMFEDLDPPANSFGPVRSVGRGRWIMDTRAEPAALVIPNRSHHLVVWGEEGVVRLFALHDPSR